jgi:hypothetical protein
LEQQLDVITFVARVNDKRIVVWEFEGELALSIHLQVIRIDKDLLTSQK